MKPRDFERALESAESTLRATPMPEDAAHRVRRRLHERRPSRALAPRRLVFAIGLAAATAGVAIALWPGAPPAPSPFEVEGFFLVSEAGRLRTEGEGRVVAEAGRAIVAEPRWGGALALEVGARVAREARGLRVVGGEVRVHVRRRPAGAERARILVSHGTIEVMGTTFTVRQDEGGGEVRLHEGAIVFVDALGQTRLRPGERLRWPRAQAASMPAPTEPEKDDEPASPSEEPIRPDAPTEPSPAPEPAGFDVEALLHRVAVLRSRGRFEDARRSIAEALRAKLSAATRERLSFELGTLYTRHLGAPERACAHWRRHAARFPEGRYAREIQQAMGDLRCGER